MLTFKFREAHILFKAGKGRDGYFDSDALLKQIDLAIDIFEEHTNKFAMGLFLFDNAPSHQKRADDALSARKMPKNPKKGWTHRKGGAQMRSTVLPSGEIQDLYFLDDLPPNHPNYNQQGWFKGMEQIIQERGLWPESGLNRECDVSRRISLSPFPTLRHHSGTPSGPSDTFQAFPSLSIKFLPFQSTPFLTPPFRQHSRPSLLFPASPFLSAILRFSPYSVSIRSSPFLSAPRFYPFPVSPSLSVSRLYPFLTASARPVSWTVSCLTSYQTSHYRQMLLSYHAVLLRDLSVYKAVHYGS